MCVLHQQGQQRQTLPVARLDPVELTQSDMRQPHTETNPHPLCSPLLAFVGQLAGGRCEIRGAECADSALCA